MTRFFKLFLCLSVTMAHPLAIAEDTSAPDNSSGMTQLAKLAETSQMGAGMANMATGSTMMMAGQTMVQAGSATGSFPLVIGGIIMMGMGMKAEKTGKEMTKTAAAAGEASTFSSIDTTGTSLSSAQEDSIDNFAGSSVSSVTDAPRNNALMKAKGIRGSEAAIAEMERLGYQVDEDAGTIMTPDGKMFGSDDFSEKGMLANGLSKSMAQSLMNKIGQLEEKAMEKFGGVEGEIVADSIKPADDFVSSSGSSGIGGGFDFGSPDNDTDAYIPPARPKISGLTKKLGDSRIGVASDSLFDLVKKRYNDLGKAGFFIPEELKKKN